MKNKDLIKQLKNLKKTSINESSLDSIKKNFKEYMAFYSPEPEKELPTTHKLRGFISPALKFASIVVIIGLILGGGRAVYASLPGEALYPIKLITEDLHEMVIFDQSKKALFEIHLAEKRIKEIESLEKKEAVDNKEIEKTKNRLNNHLEKAEKFSSREPAVFKEKIEKNIKLIKGKIEKPKNENIPEKIKPVDKINNSINKKNLEIEESRDTRAKDKTIKTNKNQEKGGNGKNKQNL
jgi:hypothetical protein